jgi:hypothetical protein
VSDLISPETAWNNSVDGYRVEAAFVLWESNSVLQVPANTLFGIRDKWAVFNVEKRHRQTPHRRSRAPQTRSPPRSPPGSRAAIS